MAGPHRNSHRRSRLRAGALLISALWSIATPGLAEPPPPGQPRTITAEQAEHERDRLEKAVFSAFATRDYAAAETALRELIPLDKDNFVPWYNLACALSLQGKTDEAVTMLEQSIARGFADLRQLRTDPHLEALRGTESYRTIVAGWDTFLDRRIDANLEAARKVFGDDASRGKYIIEKDESLRLAYVSAFDPVLFAQSKQEINRLTRWWETMVLPAPKEGSVPPAKSPWILVILPTRPDYGRWAARRFGEDWQRIGGNYSHDNKQLVAMDLGATLRHEYWHVLHWRHMDELGQRQPVWVMEGLCSLVEDIEPVGDGPDSTFRALPSWRTNMARRLARGGGLMPWETLFAMEQRRFVASRPLAMYAQSRAIFMYLLERGKLREWYADYTGGFAEDPSGKRAFERVFGRPLKETERDFRLWLLSLPEVQESVGDGPANLPFDVGPGTGDGPVIESLTSGPTRDAGLRIRDVLTSIDGKPVRDLNDLARILGEYEAGATVQVGYRRRGQHGTAPVVLLSPSR